MSAFIVDDLTINRIVTELYDGERHDHIKRRLAKELNIRTPQELATAMLQLNDAAVAYRYDEPLENTPIAFKRAPARLIQVYKSLRCWAYQCSEGKIDETPLFQIMHEFIDSVGYDIISALPEFEAAQWG